MPIYKRCSRCNKRLPSGTQCTCTDQRYKEEDKLTKGTKEKKFYLSTDWIQLRLKAIAKYNGMDIYSYYILGTIEYGATVHHVTPIKDDWDKRLDISNLIYLSNSNHQILHSKMKHSKADYDDVIALLYSLIERYENEFDNDKM